MPFCDIYGKHGFTGFEEKRGFTHLAKKSDFTVLTKDVSWWCCLVLVKRHIFTVLAHTKRKIIILESIFLQIFMDKYIIDE